MSRKAVPLVEEVRQVLTAVRLRSKTQFVGRSSKGSWLNIFFRILHVIQNLRLLSLLTDVGSKKDALIFGFSLSDSLEKKIQDLSSSLKDLLNSIPDF